MPALTPARRSELRAQAHGLAPVVMIGDKGLSDSVVAEVDRALKAHELIKVKAATDDREARVAWMAALCEKLAAFPVQGPGDIVEHGVSGCLNEDLAVAALGARSLDPARCRELALRYSWEASTRQFLSHLHPAAQALATTDVPSTSN